MAIIGTQHHPEDVRLSVSAPDKRTRSRRWHVRATTDVGPEAIILATGVTIGSAYDYGLTDAACLCKKIDAEVEEITHEGHIWRVAASYDTEVDQQQQEPNPFDRPPVVNYGAETIQRYSRFDAEGVPLRNSAGDPFEPIELDEEVLLVTIERNEPTVSAAGFANYHNRVNVGSFRGLEPQTLRLKVAATYTEEGEYQYYRVKYDLAWKESTWMLTMVDMGRREKIGGVYFDIKDPTSKQPVKEPVLLDGNGERLAPGGDPVLVDYTRYKTADFNGLALPDF